MRTFDNNQVLIFNDFDLTMPIDAARMFLGDLIPPKSNLIAILLVQITSDWSTRFYTAQPFAQPPQSYALQRTRQSLKVSIPVRASSRASNTAFTGPTRLRIPNGILIGSVTVQVTTLWRTLASSPQSECTRCCQHGHPGGKTLLQQNHPVANWGSRITLVVLYNGRKKDSYRCSRIAASETPFD